MATKLELVWAGKDEPIKPEPRILIENPEFSFSYDNGDMFSEASRDNMLIHGDNLLALKALEKDYTGKVKCIYIDPPYNTGSAFEHYDDNFEHSIWLGLMRPRLSLLNKLLSDEGVIFIQIDDNEQAYLKVLCDEIFGRNNFVNCISVNMKNIAGASGGGEDKRLKKNCEFILVYAKNYSEMPLFKGPYVYTEISDLIQRYEDEEKSWKYTTALLNPGDKEYIGSTLDGEGNDIKIYRRINPIMKSVNQVATEERISVKEAYKKHGINIFQTTNAQSSIRTRVMEFRQEKNISDDILSIEYVPRSGKYRNTVYEQFYKGDKCRLFVWLRDTSEVVDGELYKKDLVGTYWDMNAWMKNVAKEGDVSFAQSKKPEHLIQQIVSMSTNPGDLVLDSFLGSGTTAAVAQKMGRRWIGIEMGDHAYTHCKVRLDKVISGEDKGGITKDTGYTGGGSYKFYELAPTLVVKNELGIEVINKAYNAEQLAAAVALHEGFTYAPDENVFWKQSKSSESSFLFVTTSFVTEQYLQQIEATMKDGEYLLIACKAFDSKCVNYSRKITVKKIPQMLLKLCEFGKDDYSLNIVNPPVYEDEGDDDGE